MNRITQILAPLIIWAIGSCAVWGGQRPNIVVILADDMGYSDIGCYGSEIETPVLDALAASGLRFTQFYNMARCCPTRASLLTGLYPHQAGVGHMMEDSGVEGYRGELNRQCMTIGEVLKTAGYRTYLTGKWHVTQHVNPKSPTEQHNWPRQRGFDRFYGTIHGAGSFYDPNSLARDNKLISPFADPEYQPEEFFYTDAIADQAARYVREHDEVYNDIPFFMYVSFTAAHWPMHARDQDIDKYRGFYDAGYESIRAARYQKMLELGVINAEATENWPLPNSWKESDYLAWDIHNMEVYAAMIDCMDRGIGRIVESLRQTNKLENTLILYLQDNGGCAENYGRSGEGKPRAESPSLAPMSPEQLQMDMQPKQTRDGYPIRTGKGVLAGPADTYIGYGKAWATVSNTPFREYKHWTHEGGISTPLIAHWPNGISRAGELEHTPGHVIDIMATAVDLADASYPRKSRDGQPIKALEGTSLRPLFQGMTIQREALYWEHEGNRAVRRGDMKLVAKDKQKWELYDISRDRCEQFDLATTQPEVVAEMARLWEAYAKRANVLPLTPYRDKSKKFNQLKLAFQLKPNQELSRFDAPFVVERGFVVDAHLASIGPGVIVAQGGASNGWGVYSTEGKICFVMARSGQRYLIYSIPVSGSGQLQVKLSKDGAVSMQWNGEEVGSGRVPGPLTEQPLDGLQVGQDLEGAVGNYAVPNTYAGTIDSVLIQLLK